MLMLGLSSLPTITSPAHLNSPANQLLLATRPRPAAWVALTYERLKGALQLVTKVRKRRQSRVDQSKPISRRSYHRLEAAFEPVARAPKRSQTYFCETKPFPLATV